MSAVQVVLFIAAWLSLAIGMVSSIGAHLAADHSKRNGLAPSKTSDFYGFSTNPFFLRRRPILQSYLFGRSSPVWQPFHNALHQGLAGGLCIVPHLSCHIRHQPVHRMMNPI